MRKLEELALRWESDEAQDGSPADESSDSNDDASEGDVLYTISRETDWWYRKCQSERIRLKDGPPVERFSGISHDNVGRTRSPRHDPYGIDLSGMTSRLDEPPLQWFPAVLERS